LKEFFMASAIDGKGLPGRVEVAVIATDPEVK